MIQGSVQFYDMSASEALRKYAGMQALRGKSMAETMKKVMKFWVSFAIAKVPKGDAEKIMRDMQTIVTNYSRLGTRRGKTADAWRGTYAAMLVAMLNWQGARKLKGAAFYAKARMFANRRRFAANLHRSGMRPAMMRLRAKMTSAGRLPQFKNQPGGYVERVGDRVVDILVENWAKAGSKRSGGITKLAPHAFTDALAEVDAMLAEFFLQDVKKWADKVGLTPGAA